MKTWLQIVNETVKMGRSDIAKARVDFVKVYSVDEDTKVFVATNEVGFNYLQSAKAGGIKANWSQKLQQPWTKSKHVFVVYITPKHKYIIEIHPLLLVLLNVMDENGKKVDDDILNTLEQIIQKNKKPLAKISKIMEMLLTPKHIEWLKNRK